ncbi:fam-l protein [Plasmodium brasilianum]|uniref:Fam-l protein n=1 Tax=Plasmodium brasilianum TaxID=5824 RepID=A0ACB9YED0_PLABR|nr:fam-l protein [Plasmodium brasilianum]
MEQNIKTLLFIRITTFILLCWTYPFYTYVSTLKKSLEEGDNYYRKLHSSNYHLLKKYKHNKNSRFLCLKNEIQINGVPEKKDIFHNENDDSEKKKAIEKICIKYCRTISNKVYTKIICKKYGLRIVLPLLICLFLLIIFIVEVSLTYSNSGSLLHHIGLNKEYLETLAKNNGPWSPIVGVLKILGEFLQYSTSSSGTLSCGWCQVASEVSDMCILGNFFRILIFFVPFVLLSITLISGIFYYHKKVKKYEKIKFEKR